MLSEQGAQLAGTRTRGGLLPLRKERLFKPGGAVAVKASLMAAVVGSWHGESGGGMPAASAAQPPNRVLQSPHEARQHAAGLPN